jgi:low temperature requirement protein LtrA
MLALYIISSLVIIQAWLYMTTYVNRYAMWRWYEYALTVVNMAATIVMSTTISESYIEGGTAFVISMIVMISCVGTLYAIQLYIEKQDVAAARNSFEIIMVVLLIYGASLVLSLCGFKEESLLINVFAVILGIALLLFKHGDYDLKIISLPHLIERLELLTIITFGEGIVAITGFFTVSEISAVSVMIFLTLIFMFGSYVAQVHYICNHHQLKRSSAITASHYFIVLSINLVTVALLYFKDDSADHLFTACLMSASLAMFHVALLSTSSLNLPEFSCGRHDMLKSLALVGAGASVIFAFMDGPYGFIVGSLVATGGNFYMLWRKYSSNRCVNVIHSVKRGRWATASATSFVLHRAKQERPLGVNTAPHASGISS